MELPGNWVEKTKRLIRLSELVFCYMVLDKGEGPTVRDPVEEEKGARSLFNRFLHSKHSNKYLAVIILLIASIPRFFYLGRDIQSNGVDEGVQIMAGRMRDAGYEFYTQINTVQAPLMISLYGIIEGDPVIFRIFSTIASLIVLACVLWVGRRVGGRYVMVAAGAFAAMDLMFLHESRLASLDMFCLLWIALSIGFFIKYRQSGKKWAVLFMGASLGIGSMIKLFAVIAAGTMGIIIFLDWLNDTDAGPLKKFRTEKFLPGRKFQNVKFRHMVLLLLSYSLVVLFIMARFGFMDVVEGMLLNQLNRPVAPFTTKLQFLGVFALLNSFALPFFFIGLKPLYKRTEGVILIITFVFFIYFMFQATTWIHHFVFLSPGIAITAGVGVIEFGKWITKVTRRNKRRSRRELSRSASRTMIYIQVILVLLVAVIGGGFSILVKERGPSAQYKAASLIEDITEPEDYVFSGDPLINAIADRRQPWTVVNVAKLKYPDITNDQLNETTIKFGVEAVILTYHLAEMEGFVDFVEEHYTLRAEYRDNSLPLLESEEIFRVYSLSEESELRDHELWALLWTPLPNEM